MKKRNTIQKLEIRTDAPLKLLGDEQARLAIEIALLGRVHDEDENISLTVLKLGKPASSH